MVKHLLYVSLACLLSFSAFAQLVGPKNHAVLKKQLEETTRDSNRVIALIAISHNYNVMAEKNNQYRDSAYLFARQAKSLSESLNYTKGIGLSYQEIARFMARRHRAQLSTLYLDKAIKLFAVNHMVSAEAETWLLKEEFYMATGGQDVNVRISFYEKAKELFTRAGSTERLAATLKILGDFYQIQDDYTKSLAALKQSLVLYKKSKVRELQGLYDLLAYVSSLKGDYEAGIKYGLDALRTAEAVHDSSLQLCTIYHRLGLTYSFLKLPVVAEAYYSKALNIAVKFTDTTAILQVLTSDASVLTRINKPELAIQKLNYYTKKFPTANKELQVDLMVVYLNAYVTAKQLDKAGQVYNKMNALARSINSEDVGMRLAFTRYFTAIKQFNNAWKNLELYKNSGHGHLLAGRMTYYTAAYRIDSVAGNFSGALNSYLQYTRLKDSVFNVKKNQQIQELKIRYESQKQEHDIISLKKDAIVQREKVNQANHTKNIIAAGLVATLILVSLLLYSYRVNKRNARAINKSNLLLKQLVTEKEWLIKEIHHRVKNNLQIVTGLLQRQSAYIDNDDALTALQNSENRMHAIALIHQKLYQSESLHLINMPEYIEEMISYLKDMCSLGNRIIFDKHVEDIQLDVNQAVPVGLIINEAITNAIKYAYTDGETGIIYITLVRNQDQYNQLTIADNGRGLPADFDIEKVDSLGINLMLGLSKQLGGVLELSNEQGCMINVIFKTETFSKGISRE